MTDQKIEYMVQRIPSTHLATLPDAPGIYLFYDTHKELIYVGKATSLKSRVKSYFAGQRTPRPIEEMIHEVCDIKWKENDSVLEAVILEAIYIKKFQPKYNVLGKDDKSWNYIVITNDAFPRIETRREQELRVIASRSAAAGEASQSPITQNDVILKNKGLRRRSSLAPRNDAFKNVFGPYPGLNTKETLKLLRKLFRYSSCKPNQGRPCLYREIGQCLGVCTGEISATDYKKQVIRPLVLFLSGKKQTVMKLFEREMREASKMENFEVAVRLRDQLKALRRIQDIALLNESFVSESLDSRLSTLNYQSPESKVQRPLRIEGYDISNLGATEKVGSMVVFDEREPIKSDYRKFIIKTVPGQSDLDCLEEVLRRRLKHTEWPLPHAILIDGGRPQVQRALKILHDLGMTIPLLGIAKGPERKRNDVILGTKNPNFIRWTSSHRELLIRVRDEAHRFAITFHRQRRNKRLYAQAS